MSNITFVYCFSKTLSVNEEQYAISLELLKESIELLKVHHDYRIVTDKNTFQDLQALSSDIEIVDSENFKFIDDFKVGLLLQLKDNEIIIDPDILIYDKLTVRFTSNCIFNNKDTPNSRWYKNSIEELKGTLLYERIKSTNTLSVIPNIGFLRVENKDLLSSYLTQYKIYREDILLKLPNNYRGFSIFLGQYLLGILLYEGNYSYISIRDINTKGAYEHRGGPRKFKMHNKIKTFI